MDIPSANIKRTVVLNREEVLNSKKTYKFFKRVLDILLSFTALILLSPVFLIILLIVFIDSPKTRPIFVQERIGINGKKFFLLKFRTMVPDAEKQLDALMPFNEMDEVTFKIKNDPRITKVGKILRKTSLDELPQLINIFKGDMSLVGPRPPLPREFAKYDEYDMQRLYVIPGLTCYWQTLPNRNNIAFRQWVALDVKYIQEQSLFTDFKIILKTIPAVLKMNGI